MPVIEVIDETEQQPKRKTRKEKKLKAAETKTGGEEAPNLIQQSPKTETNLTQVVPVPETCQESETKIDIPAEVVVVPEIQQELSTDTNVSSIVTNTNVSQIVPIVEDMGQIANLAHETKSEDQSVPNATLIPNVPKEMEPIVNGTLVQTTEVLASSSVAEPSLTNDDTESFVLVPTIHPVSTPSAVSNADVVLTLPVEEAQATTHVKDEKAPTKQKKRLPTRKSKKKHEGQDTTTQAPLTLHVVPPLTEEKDIAKVVATTTQALVANDVLFADNTANATQEKQNHDSKTSETKTPQSPPLPATDESTTIYKKSTSSIAAVANKSRQKTVRFDDKSTTTQETQSTIVDESTVVDKPTNKSHKETKPAKTKTEKKPPVPNWEIKASPMHAWKIHIRLNSSTLTDQEMKECVQKYQQVLTEAKDRSLEVFYNAKNIDLQWAWKKKDEIEKLLLPLRPLIEKKLAKCATCIPYGDLVNYVKTILDKYPTTVPNFIGSTEETCRTWLQGGSAATPKALAVD